MTGQQNRQHLHDTLIALLADLEHGDDEDGDDEDVVDPVTDLLTEQELADRWRMSIRSIRRMRNAGDLPYVRIGRLVRFDPNDIAEWLERQKGSAA